MGGFRYSYPYRVENTHEAIIDKVTWELAQAVRQGKRRRTAMGGINKYSGLLYCADCNSKLYFIRETTLKPDAYGFICSRYRKHMGEEQCTPHSIRAKVLDYSNVIVHVFDREARDFYKLDKLYTDFE